MPSGNFNPNNFPRRNHGYEREEPEEETIGGNALRFVHESDVKAPTFRAGARVAGGRNPFQLQQAQAQRTLRAKAERTPAPRVRSPISGHIHDEVDRGVDADERRQVEVAPPVHNFETGRSGMGGINVNAGTGPNAMSPEQMQQWQQTMQRTGMNVTPNAQGGFGVAGQGQPDPIAQSVLSYKGLVDDHHLQMMKDMANSGATVDDLHKAGELGIKAKQTLDDAKQKEADRVQVQKDKELAQKEKIFEYDNNRIDKQRTALEKNYPGIESGKIEGIDPNVINQYQGIQKQQKNLDTQRDMLYHPEKYQPAPPAPPSGSEMSGYKQDQHNPPQAQAQFPTGGGMPAQVSGSVNIPQGNLNPANIPHGREVTPNEYQRLNQGQGIPGIVPHPLTNLPIIQSQEDYDKLPPGTPYHGPKGPGVKPNEEKRDLATEQPQTTAWD